LRSDVVLWSSTRFMPNSVTDAENGVKYGVATGFQQSDGHVLKLSRSVLLLSVGEYHRHLSGKHSRTQRRCHVVACVLRIHRLLDDKRDLLLSQFRRLHCRLRWLVLPLHLICYNISLLVSIYTFHL